MRFLQPHPNRVTSVKMDFSKSELRITAACQPISDLTNSLHIQAKFTFDQTFKLDMPCKKERYGILYDDWEKWMLSNCVANHGLQCSPQDFFKE